jgi:hypothetical protein
MTPREFWNNLLDEFQKGAPDSEVNTKCNTISDLAVYAMGAYAQSKLPKEGEEVRQCCHKHSLKHNQSSHVAWLECITCGESFRTAELPQSRPTVSEGEIQALWDKHSDSRRMDLFHFALAIKELLTKTKE